MKKLILAASALALGTAASANEHQAQHDEDMTADTAETSVYDGPDSYTATQPPPTEANPDVNSQRIANYNVEMRETYPVCTTDIRDNCVQRTDPGGSNLDLANEGTLGVNGIVNAVGGPDEDEDW